MYLAVKHGDAPPDVSGRTVAIFDFAFPAEETLLLISKSRQLVVIDHHESAVRRLCIGSKLLREAEGVRECVRVRECARVQKHMLAELPRANVYFAMEHSAAVLAWQFFYGRQQHKAMAVDAVRVAPLWSVSQTDDRPFDGRDAMHWNGRFLDMMPLDFGTFTRFEDETYLAQCVEKGRVRCVLARMMRSFSSVAVDIGIELWLCS
jgi:hypothetical protein